METTPEVVQNPPDSDLKGIGGWLLLFIISLFIGTVMDIAYIADHATESWAVMCFTILHVFGLYVAYRLISKASDAVKLAKIYLYIFVGLGALSFLGSLIPPSTANGAINCIKIFGYGCLWLGYMSSSKRIKNTYPSVVIHQ